MKKVLCLAAVAALLVNVQFAYSIIAVAWGSSEGFYKSDGVTALLGDTNRPQFALAQLIYTPDPIPDPVDPSNPHYVSGNDVWLMDTLIDTAWSEYGEFIANPPFTSEYMAGWLFVRVFDQGSHIAITAGMWYYDSPLTNTIDNTSDPMIPDDIDIGLMTPEYGDVLDKQVIPEPATWALMLVGGAALARKKLRRE